MREDISQRNYPERADDGEGRADAELYQTPGTKSCDANRCFSE